MRVFYSVATVLTLAGSSAFASVSQAKNTILFIGDGMGPGVVTATRPYQHGAKGSLYMEKFKHTGLSRTASSSDSVTDSAAAGTALASGKRTSNGVVGMISGEASDGTISPQPVTTLVDLAEKAGKSIGIITTTSVTDATPASFYAHVPNRTMGEDIANQLMDRNLTVVLGGGSRHFSPDYRTDKKDLFKQATSKNYTVLKDRAGLLNAKPTADGKFFGIFAKDALNNAFENKGPEHPTLSEMVQFAISQLSQNPKGYFLMVEAALIDIAGHANDAKNMIGNTLEFDESIKTAHQLAGTSTLIVITADHDTAGMTVSAGLPLDMAKGPALLATVPNFIGEERYVVTFASGPNHHSVGVKHHPTSYYAKVAHHTAIDVPIIAVGPGASDFTGYMDNTEIPKKIAKNMGLAFPSNQT